MGSWAIILSAFAFYFSTYFVALGHAKSSLPVVYYVFSRFLVGLILFEILLRYKNELPPIKNPRGLYERAFWNSLAVYFYLYAVAISGITKGNILNMTYPIFVTLLAPLYTKERVGFQEVFGVFLSFAGCYLIISQGIWFSFSFKDFLGLLSGLTGAIAVLSLRDIRQNESTWQIIKIQFRTGFVISFFVLLFSEKPQLSEFKAGWFYLILSGVLGFLGQILLTYGFRYVSSVEGSLLSSLRIFIAYIFGILLGKESPEFLRALGALFIFGANVLVVKKPPPEE